MKFDQCLRTNWKDCYEKKTAFFANDEGDIAGQNMSRRQKNSRKYNNHEDSRKWQCRWQQVGMADLWMKWRITRYIYYVCKVMPHRQNVGVFLKTFATTNIFFSARRAPSRYTNNERMEIFWKNVCCCCKFTNFFKHNVYIQHSKSNTCSARWMAVLTFHQEEHCCYMMWKKSPSK